MSVNFKKHGHFFLPEAMLIHNYTWFYYGNYVDPTCNTIILKQGYQRHRQLILYMVNTSCIPTTNKINKLKGFHQYISPYFPVESYTTNIDASTDDESYTTIQYLMMLLPMMITRMIAIAIMIMIMITIILIRMKILWMMIMMFNHR